MREVHLPWESLTGPIYYARALKQRKKWVTQGWWVMSFILLAGGIATGYYVVSLFGVLYILTLLMKKDTVVTERGLEIYYQMRITTHYDLWNWSDINSIVREDRNHPELIALHIGKGNASKQLFFTKEDAKQIIVLARKKNSTIKIMDAAVSGRNAAKKKKY
ncbi:MAG: hypothetical protein ACOYBL_04410 [Lachnospiraceae bacterium]